ncbi:endonuclease/exonuclease/phosphatase family protein [Oxalicibacterium faecigallinarum]|uniref:Nuclease n=1 Tax=Oxalicibacterium faecigallinarum TaxID=573741 RepID=A0A8J3AUS5_9BURK|nr:endonuclease/exonuclease/phosphatase family protein [Oxalicibacterium faecigallinarum]GGI21473.1 nuclease [Oxalicibacterium faecigallinarum]
MQQELRFATFNVCNLALPGVKYYDDQPPYSPDEYETKIRWIAQQLDRLDADVIGLQEIFSQVAIKDVLARTRLYRDAHHVGVDPDPAAEKLTPSVALISRLPIAEGAGVIGKLPHQLAITLPGVPHPVTDFTRPILHAEIIVSPSLSIDTYVCHLKSKLPDYRNDGSRSLPDPAGLAMLRSLIRRGTDALGLRYLLAEQTHATHRPIVVMGDFNDVADAISTQMVMGLEKYPQEDQEFVNDRLFESYRIQSRRDPLRDVGYTHIHEGNFETIDHILVSAAFNPALPEAIGEVLDVRYLNDHMIFQEPQASDHGIVLVRIGLYDTDISDLPLA